MSPSTAPSSNLRTAELACGIRLATEVMPDVHSVAIGLWVGTGSRDEPAEFAGASHFLEHLLFKGTNTRSASAIAESVDEVGGDCNAFTTKEYTTFYIRLLAEHFPLGLEILSEITTDPALRPEDVDSERTVVLDEILMHADEPADLVAERWTAALFPEHPLGRDTLGDAATVGSFDAARIRQFFDLHYRTGNMVVSVAGDCDPASAAEAVERRFSGRTGGQTPDRRPPALAPEHLVVVRRPTEQAHLVLGARSVSRFDERRWAFSVLNHILGGGLSSRLFQKVREQRGLAYSIWSERSAYRDSGSLAVVAGTAPEHVNEVLRIVTGELELMASEGVTDRELSIAKRNLRAEIVLAGEDSGARMSRIGSALLLHGEVETVDDVLGHLEAVGVEDVRAAAVQLADAPRSLAAVGPFDEDAFDTDALGLTPSRGGTAAVMGARG